MHHSILLQPIFSDTSAMIFKDNNPLETLVERRQSRPSRDLSLISSTNAVYNGRANSKRVGFLPAEISVEVDVEDDVEDDATRLKAAEAKRIRSKRDLRRSSTDVTDFTDVSEMSVSSRNTQGTVESNFSASLPNLRDSFWRDERLIGGSFRRRGSDDFAASDGALFKEVKSKKQVRRQSDAMVRCQEVLEWVKARTDKNRRKVHFC